LAGHHHRLHLGRGAGRGGLGHAAHGQVQGGGLAHGQGDGAAVGAPAGLHVDPVGARRQAGQRVAAVAGLGAAGQAGGDVGDGDERLRRGRRVVHDPAAQRGGRGLGEGRRGGGREAGRQRAGEQRAGGTGGGGGVHVVPPGGDG